MGNKILIILVVAVVVIVAGAAAFFMLNNGSNDTKDSDYTLLDSTDNIKEGLTVTMEGKASGGTASAKYVVNSVEDAMVNYTETMVEKSIPETNMSLNIFSPDRFIFDYTDPDDYPEGVNVVVNGDKYKISGQDDASTTTYTSKTTYDLTITYDGEAVTAASGDMKRDYSRDGGYTNIAYHFKMSDGKLKATMDEDVKAEASCNKNVFFDRTVNKFDVNELKDAEVNIEEGKFGGVDVLIYTVNGPVGQYEYKDVKIYVYDGYALKQEGTLVDQNGNSYKASVMFSIYQTKN